MAHIRSLGAQLQDFSFFFFFFFGSSDGAGSAAGFGAGASAAAVVVVPELPRTRSAKILRRAIRATVVGSEPGDLSSLENPSSLESIRTAIG